MDEPASAKSVGGLGRIHVCEFTVEPRPPFPECDPPRPPPPRCDPLVPPPVVIPSPAPTPEYVVEGGHAPVLNVKPRHPVYVSASLSQYRYGISVELRDGISHPHRKLRPSRSIPRSNVLTSVQRP